LEDKHLPIEPDLLEILICPACRGKVELKADGNALKCVACRRFFPIRDCIPAMVVEEATIDVYGAPATN
jgi:uncharacterized protein YbaR (Trm112 family)